MWKKDGIPIRYGRVSVSQGKNIRIDRTEPGDSGIYECHGYTENGKGFVGYSELLVAS